MIIFRGCLIHALIPDNEGNHLVVVLSIYDNNEKTDSFQIPQEYEMGIES